MADDKSKAGMADRSRIDVNQEYELRNWAYHFSTSEARINEAVAAVGPMVKDVEKYLEKK